MEPPSRKRASAIEWIIVVAILGGLFVLIAPAVQAVRNPKGPYGKTIPTAAPDEANRLVHPTGVSIIVPKNWDQIHDLGPEEPFVCVAARGVPGAGLKSFITIQKTEPPGEAVFSSHSRTSFQGYPAYERMEVDRATFDDPSSSYSLYVDIAGEWWSITWVVGDVIRELPPQIKTYIDTIRLPNDNTNSEQGVECE